MADMTVVAMERTDLIEAEFKALVLSVEGVEHFLEYRDESIPKNTVVMYFDWRSTGRQATGRISSKRWEWIVEIYVHGSQRKEMQRRLKQIIIGIDHELEKNPKLNRAASKPVETQNMGPPLPFTTKPNGMRGLLKRFRLIAEAEQAA